MPEYALTTDQMRKVDALMMQIGIPGDMLMLNAAKAVVEEVLEMKPSRVLIFCGIGSNAGDGYACAWLLGIRAINVDVVDLSGAKRLPEYALMHYSIASNCPHVSIRRTGNEETISETVRGFPDDGVIIDAIFGIGLSRAPEDVFKSAIDEINASDARVVAVDMPSGIDATTGLSPGVSVRADVTVTFQHMKTGQMFYPGREQSGRLRVEQIGFYERVDNYCEVLTDTGVLRMFPRRKRDAHKGDFGRGLLIAGSEGMAGAAILCARAALRAGIGLLTIAAPDYLADALRIAVPEAMMTPLHAAAAAVAELDGALEGKRVVAIGPGMGKGKAVSDIVWHILNNTALSILMDADALNVLGLVERLANNVIITPHPGEMSRLCGIPSSEIVKAPLEIATRFAKEWDCTIVLKGAVSVIASHDGRVTLNTTGNPGLAKGGSGDVLTGLILALVCQGLSHYDAARCGAYLAGRAADIARESTGERGMLASDVIDAITRALPDF